MTADELIKSGKYRIVVYDMGDNIYRYYPQKRVWYFFWENIIKDYPNYTSTLSASKFRIELEEAVTNPKKSYYQPE